MKYYVYCYDRCKDDTLILMSRRKFEDIDTAYEYVVESKLNRRWDFTYVVSSDVVGSGLEPA